MRLPSTSPARKANATTILAAAAHPSSPVVTALVATALGALALTGCSAGTETAAPPPAPTVSAPPTTSAPSAASPPAPPTLVAEDVQRLALTVAGGEVTGDTGTVPIELGVPVELTVTSDVADEVHVHGADVSEGVSAGGTVVLRFVQEAPGRFEVELENSRRLLTRLQVS